MEGYRSLYLQINVPKKRGASEGGLRCPWGNIREASRKKGKAKGELIQQEKKEKQIITRVPAGETKTAGHVLGSYLVREKSGRRA